MRPRVSGAKALGFAAILLLAVPTLWAQQATTISISERTLRIDGLLRQGRDLETQRRWGEALVHYEEAVRTYPEEATLERRFGVARAHYDLGRRYADKSFCNTLGRMTLDEALDLYGQVLVKMQAHYVEPPRWQDLVDRGTDNFETALGEPAFLDRNLPQRDPRAIADFCRELRAALGRYAIGSRGDARACVAQAAALAQQRLGLTPASVVLEYLCGATNSLDPYSAFLTPDQLGEVYAQIEGNFVGLGVELKTTDGTLLVVRVIGGSPAEQAGVRGGDRILAVDGRLVSELSVDKAANMLQGLEGSLVTLTVGGPKEPPREMTVRRQKVEVASVDQVQMLDPENGVAYLRLTCFQKTTRRDVESALWRLHRAGMRSLIVDVRGNPGGLLVSSVEVADLFLEQGVIVSTHGRSTQEDFTYSAHAEGTWRMPLTVVVDQDSASAAEIFAGAIHDHRRGTIVGVRSFGKGSVQGIFPLDSFEAGVRLTTAKFYSPTGRPYSRTGVEPDVLVHQTARPTSGAVTAQDDATLAAALGVARKK